MAKLQSTKAIDAKETIYVDVDDEITGIIDKVRSSKAKVVALVLPKRATVFQSIVNMKLLKRAAETAKKHLVLVTSEAGLLPLAGSVGLHVAATPTSKPSIPPVPDTPGDEPEEVDEPLAVIDGTADGVADDEFNAETASKTPVGVLAAAGATGVAASKLSSPSTVDEEISMDDSGEPASDAAAGKGKASKPKKDRKLAVPNFDSFRNKLLLGAGVLALLIVAWIFAFVVLPKATVTVHTDTSTVSTNLNLTLDTTAKTLNVDQNIVPATAQTTEKSSNQQVPATGQQNNGEKAKGEVTMTAKKCGGNPFDPPSAVPSGTGVSSGGQTYITQDQVTFHGTGSSGGCYDYASNGSADILAVKAGTSSNTGASATFTVSGRSDVSATGSAEGGTDNITKIVSQADIDSAKSKLTTQDTAGVRGGLQAALQGKSLTPVTVTFIAGEPTVTTSSKVGDAADTVTVTQVTSYTMLGVKPADLKTLTVSNVNKQINKSKQVILDDGVAKAKFTQSNPGSATAASVAYSTKSIAGPDVDTEAIRQQVAGKKSGEIKSQIGDLPGVTSVEVSYSPFWVHSTPKNVSKITVQIDKANTGKQ